MAPPTPVTCSVEGCGYITPQTVPTWDLLRDMLKLHVDSVHCGGQDRAGPATVRPKPAPVSRPEIDLGASEHEWKFFKAEFDRYKRTTGIVGTTVLDELWHCQAKNLRTLMQAETAVSDLDTEQKLLEKIKSLAVVTLHSAVHLVELRNIQQGQSEPIRKFVARARNIASSCNLMKKITGTDCNEDVSFLYETVFGVILAGLLRDTNIQQKILSLAAMKTIQTLEVLVTYVAAEESGYKEIANIGQNAGTVGGVKSTYTRNKGKCLNCGNSKHGDGSADDKAKHCPAYGKTCSRCDKKNHLSSVCRSKPKVAAVTKDRVEETPVNASLNFFGIRASSHDELALETAPKDIH